MKNILVVCTCLLVQLFQPLCYAQKKIVVLGSSTAAGYGAFPADSSWVNRLQASLQKNMTDGFDTIVDNRGVPTYVTYQSLPTDYPTPSGRPLPDPYANVTYVLNLNPRPNIVIINYPTNDIVNNYDPKEMMNNLRLMFQQFLSNGIFCYITTSQPRNTTTVDQRTILRQVVDSIKNNFGNYSIDFWSDLVTADGSNMLKTEVDADGTHPNNLGHRLLFQKVAAKNMFSIAAGAPLPLKLKSWEASLENNSVQLNWSSTSEEPLTSFEIQRSNNGVDFQTICQKQGKGNDASYSWTDAAPLNGKNYYRLKISEPTNHVIYSRTIAITNNKKQLITSLYTDPSQLHLQLQANSNQSADITIIDYSGAVLKKQSANLRGASTNVVIPISGLRSGDYFVRIVTSDGSNAVERFSIMK